MKFAKKSVSLLLSIIMIISVFAIVPMAASADTATIAVFFTDSQSWDGADVINVYAWNADGVVTAAWPGDPMTYLYDNDFNGGQSIYGAKIPATATAVIFNCGGNQTGDIESGIVDGAWWYSDNNVAVALNNTYVAAQAATCTEAGVAAHYDLDDNVYDVNLNATTEEAVVIPAAGHTLSHVEAVDATPTTDGNVEYWHCTVCEKNFSDAEGTTEIADVVVPASGVATINGTPYTSLAAAVAAAEDGDTIKVIADCDAAYISVKGKAITINVASKATTITGVQYAGMDVPMFKVASTGSLTFTGSGTVINENDAVVNSNGFVKAGGPTLSGNLCAIYNGGTAQVTYGKVIGVQAAIINGSQTATATISGGQIYGKLENGDPDATFVVSGGIFDAPVDADFLSEDIAFELARTDGRYSYTKMNNSILNTGDGVLKMLKDTSATARMAYGTFSHDVTLDLNGYTLTSTATDMTILMGRDGTADSPRILNIVDNSVNGGGQIIGATDNSKSTSALISISSPYNYVTIGEDVYLEGGVIALLGDHQTLDVYGAVNGLDDFAVATNGADTTNATINIHDDAILSSDDVAVYLPGGAVTTIDDAYIIGSTAVYIKSGTTTITDGEFRGIGEAKDYKYNGNGADATGDALVVDSCGYPGGMPVVTVTGGNFDSTNAAPVASYQYGNNAKLLHFISGGEYSAILDEDLIADGYFCEVVKNADGYYNVVPDTCTAHNFAYFADDKAVACTICGKGYTGLWDVTDEDTYYFEKGLICKDKGLIEIDGDYYYVVYNGKIKKDADRTVPAEKTNGLPIAPGVYHFDEDGKLVIKDKVIDENGYYWEDGVIAKDKGLIYLDGYYYYVVYTGKVKMDADRTVPADKTNGLPVPAGVYHFDEEGKMTNPPEQQPENGVGSDGFYREEGVIVKDKGLIEYEGDYYYVVYNGKIKIDGDRTVVAEKNNTDLPNGTYHFGVDGKMTNVPVMNGVGGDGYYRVNGEIVKDAGIIEYEGDLYYVVYNGKVKMNASRTVTEEKANGYVPAGLYHFDAEGKMIDRPTND